MKKVLLIFLLAFNLLLNAQSYLGYVTKTVNFRTEPNTSCSVIKSLPIGTPLFVITKSKINNFYQVIDIQTNKEGYVHSNYVHLDKKLPKNENGIFTPVAKTESVNPIIKIYNNTYKTLSLKLNDKTYTFAPQESQTLTLTSGSYSYRASAPGVIPNYGTEVIESNYEYEWRFYISTKYR